jgi:ABC-type multidrug transport system permease subunit
MAGDTTTAMVFVVGGAIVTIALADLVVSVNEVAEIVTVPPTGTMEGAVYAVEICDELVVGLNEPHAVEPQAAVQITPAPVGSLVTRAWRSMVVLGCTELGG